MANEQPHPHEAYHKITKALKQIEQGTDASVANPALKLMENSIRYLRSRDGGNGFIKIDDEAAGTLYSISADTLTWDYLLPGVSAEERKTWDSDANKKDFIERVVMRNHFKLTKDKFTSEVKKAKTLSAFTLPGIAGVASSRMIHDRKDRVSYKLADKVQTDAEEAKKLHAYVSKMATDNKSVLEKTLSELEAEGVKLTKTPDPQRDVSVWLQVAGQIPDDYKLAA